MTDLCNAVVTSYISFIFLQYDEKYFDAYFFMNHVRGKKSMLDIHTKREIKVKHCIVVYWFFNFLFTVLVCPCVLKGTMSFSQIFNFHSPYVSLWLLLINLMTLGIPWRNYQEKKNHYLPYESTPAIIIILASFFF